MAPLTQWLASAGGLFGTLRGRQAASRFTTFDVPTPFSSPCDLYTAPDGDIYASTFTADNLIHIDRSVTPNKLREIPIPYTRDQLPLAVLPQRFQGLGSCVIQPGLDGNVWAATGVRNELVRYDPRTGNFTILSNAGGPLGNLQPFNDMWPAEKGMYFTQTTANLLTFIDYDTLESTNYVVPTPLSSPVGVLVVPNGDVWICGFVSQKMIRFRPSTEEFTEYPVPPTLLGPGVTRAYTEDNGVGLVWFTALVSNAIGSINVETGEYTTYPNTNLGIPIENTKDGKDNIWFSTAASNTLNYLKPSTGRITEIQVPRALDIIPALPISIPPMVGIAMHWSEQDNSMWYTEFLNNRIGRYQLDGSE